MTALAAPDVHPTAVVHPRAALGAGVRVGPYAVVGDGVCLADDVEIGPHAILEGRCEIGPRVRIFAGAIVGFPPQDLRFKLHTPSGVRIGADTVVREYATIHRASVEDGWTTVGAGCYIMASSHIAHDCRVGDGVILTGFSGLTGWVEVGDRAVISGLTGIHQFGRIGTLAFVGGCSRLARDVPPYFTVEGNPAHARGLNTVGLRRAGVPADARLLLGRAYRMLYRSGQSLRSALECIRTECGPSPYIETLVDFVSGSKRGICRPRSRGAGEPGEAEE